MKIYNCNTASPLEVVVNLETEAAAYTIKGVSQRILLQDSLKTVAYINPLAIISDVAFMLVFLDTEIQ